MRRRATHSGDCDGWNVRTHSGVAPGREAGEGSNTRADYIRIDSDVGPLSCQPPGMRSDFIPGVWQKRRPMPRTSGVGAQACCALGPRRSMKGAARLRPYKDSHHMAAEKGSGQPKRGAAEKGGSRKGVRLLVFEFWIFFQQGPL